MAYNFGMQHISYKTQNNYRNTALVRLVTQVVLVWSQNQFVNGIRNCDQVTYE
jgi:hypothetical protein